MSRSLAPVREHKSVAAPRRAAFRPDIEGLRAIAVVVVMLDHLFGWPTGGFVGVDIFFVISGFLITGLLVRERERTGRISFRNFYARRIRRILPIATIVIIVTVAAAFLIDFVPKALTVSMDGLASLLFVENWHLVRAGTDYLSAATTPSPLQHFWSLSVEEQYYVAWPIGFVIVLSLADRITRLRTPASKRILLCSALAVGVAGSLIFSIWQTDENSAQAYFSTFARAWELGLGGMLALAPIDWPAMRRVWRSILAAIGLLLLAVSIFLFSTVTPFPSAFAAMPVLGTVALIAAGTGGGHAFSSVLSNNISQWIGARSYSFYLWHFPAVILLLSAFPERPVTYYVAVIAVTLVATTVFYTLVEVPVHHSRWMSGWVARGDRRPRLDIVLPILVALAIGILAAGQLRGPDWLISPPVAQPTAAIKSPFTEASIGAGIASALTTSSWPALTPTMDQLSGDSRAESLSPSGCLNDVSSSAPAECVYGDPTATKTALVIGDSVAMSWLPTIAGALSGKGWKVIGLGFSSCPIVDVSAQQRLALGSFIQHCERSREYAYARVAELAPTLTILSGTEDSLGRLTSGNTGRAATKEWTAGALSTVKTLSPRTDRLILLSNPPSGASPADCAVRTASPQLCTSAIGEHWREKFEAERDAVTQSGARNASAVDVSSWFCSSGGSCPIFIDGTPVRVDSVHLTRVFGERLSGVLAESLGL